MGQAMASETLSISGGDGHQYWVGFKMKPSNRGRKKTIYTGALLGSGPRQWEKVMVKCFTDIEGTKKAWGHEVTKADLTKQMAALFSQKYPSSHRIKVIIPGITQLDHTSKMNKWLEGRHGHRGLSENEWISVEELIPGRLSRYCPWRDEESTTEPTVHSDHLQSFSHFTYHYTHGTLVACDFQGMKEPSGRGVETYVFTDSLIHSTARLYGQFDEGELGITEFFKRHKCTRICRDWAVPTPLTPPPSFDEACSSLMSGLNITPPLVFENVVFSSSDRATSGGRPDERRQEIGRRRHASAQHHRRRREETAGDQLALPGEYVNRRRSSVGAVDSILLQRHNQRQVTRFPSREGSPIHEGRSNIVHWFVYDPRPTENSTTTTRAQPVPTEHHTHSEGFYLPPASPEIGTTTSSTTEPPSDNIVTISVSRATSVPSENGAPPAYEDVVFEPYHLQPAANTMTPTSTAARARDFGFNGLLPVRYVQTQGNLSQSQSHRDAGNGMNMNTNSNSTDTNIGNRHLHPVLARSSTDPTEFGEDSLSQSRRRSKSVNSDTELRRRRLNSRREVGRVPQVEQLLPLVMPSAPPMEDTRGNMFAIT